MSRQDLLPKTIHKSNFDSYEELSKLVGKHLNLLKEESHQLFPGSTTRPDYYSSLFSTETE